MVVRVLAPVLAVVGAGRLGPRLVRVHLAEEGVADVILLEVVLAVLTHALLRPEHGLAALVLAVEVLGILDFALLEAAALLGVEAQHVILPDILGDGVGQLEAGQLTTDLCSIGVCRWQGLGEGLGEGAGRKGGPLLVDGRRAGA